MTLADFCAEVAVECGLTVAQAADHSPAQLMLLHRAAVRLKADGVLAFMNASLAAFAAVMSKGGSRTFDKLQKQLQKQAES